MKVVSSIVALLAIDASSGFTAAPRGTAKNSLKMSTRGTNGIVSRPPAPVSGTVDPAAIAEAVAAQMLEQSRTQATVAAQQQPAPIVIQTEKSSDSGSGNILLAGVAAIAAPLWILLGTTINSNAPPQQPIQYQVPAMTYAPPQQPNQIQEPATSVPAIVTTSKPTDATPAGTVQLSQAITKAEVRKLFDLWNDALKTGDPDKVTQRYAKDGVLLPTLSDVPRNNYASIRDYFVHFLEKKPDGKILEGEIYVGNNWAQDAGIYEFRFQDGSAVKARYSFVYVFEDGQWMISHHHSSLMPEEVVRPRAVTKEEVRSLFGLWNNALKTGDPQQVAARYSSDAVLLPTLSDKARYTSDEIADYFVHFLEKKPVGTITEGNVKIGANWAQDAGLYQFAFADGSVAKGRYSFVYSYENGEWKISHHHSSLMPEPMVAAMKKVASMEKPVA